VKIPPTEVTARMGKETNLLKDSNIKLDTPPKSSRGGRLTTKPAKQSSCESSNAEDMKKR